MDFVSCTDLRNVNKWNEKEKSFCVFLYSMYTSSQYINIISVNQKMSVPFNFKPSWFTWTLLMVYSKAKFKSNGDRATPCFKPFLIGNMSDKFLPTRTLVWLSMMLTTAKASHCDCNYVSKTCNCTACKC